MEYLTPRQKEIIAELESIAAMPADAYSHFIPDNKGLLSSLYQEYFTIERAKKD